MPAAPSQPPLSFPRRHPILTGFGILAGVSLFAAYFPISAIVTGIVVGARATGADRMVFRGARSAVRWLAQHRPGRRPGASTPAPVAQSSLQRRRAPRDHSIGVERAAAPRSPAAAQRSLRPRTAVHTTPQRTQHRSRSARPVAPAERDLGL
ncbi:MAG: hypothetical protein JOY68_08815 [Candidatus Dormibacteraeota bacterium]|nr:hypothetical protein [Candidatus Dormibacteraeota bacterium]MBV8444586.1 hypothetical protein [Candidatus Dormibacteraeota bacterium]